MAARTVIGATVKAVSRQRKFAARKAALTLVRAQLINNIICYLNLKLGVMFGLDEKKY